MDISDVVQEHNGKGNGFHNCVGCGERLLDGEQEYCASCRDADEFTPLDSAVKDEELHN